jgi:predicted Zn-dependent protease
MVRISFVHPQIAERVREVLLRGRNSWAEAFAAALAGDDVLTGEPPAGIPVDVWPRLAEHVARAERVREVIAQEGLARAHARFGASKHAVERAVLLEAPEAHALIDEPAAVRGVLACEIDELLAYGHFLSRLVELHAEGDPAGTVAAFEAFVTAARGLRASDASWPERLRVAEDGLASLYVRVGRAEDAEALFQRRFDDESGDVTVAITAARAFLERGDVGRAVAWLLRGRERATKVGRGDLATRLGDKASALRARMS